jgi:hypothetical protein
VVVVSSETPTTAEMVGEIRHLSRLIDELLGDLRENAETAAREDAAYREAYSRAILAAKASEEMGRRRVTNSEAEAQADLDTIDLRVKAKVAEAAAESTKQALMARRTQLSALQSIAAAVREEMAFTRTGPSF